MKLNKKHNIPFLSVWKHKDGGLYKALKVIQASPNGSNKIGLVWYLKIRDFDEIIDWEDKGIENIFIRTVEHFKSSFTFVDFGKEQ
jgi:hypothetical protein